MTLSIGKTRVLHFFGGHIWANEISTPFLQSPTSDDTKAFHFSISIFYSPMSHLILSIYDFFARHRALLFVLLLFLTAFCLFSAYRLGFKEDIARFLPNDSENARINNAYRDVILSNHITVYCSATDTTDEARAEQVEAIDALAERLRTMPDADRIQRLRYRIDPAEMMEVAEFVTDNMPYFLTDEDYQRIDSTLNRTAIARRLEADRDILTSSVGMILRPQLLADPLRLTEGAVDRLRNMQAGGRFSLFQDHIFADDGRALLMIECSIPASETSANERFIKNLKTCMAETEREFKGVSFHSFGAVEISLSNANRIRQDALFTGILSAVIILALLIYSFRSAREIGLVFAAVLFGGLFALAALHLIRGEASTIAVGISSIIFGIAINYPLHFIGHHHHTPDPRAVIKDIVRPLTVGNVTTVSAFMSLVFINSDAMRDLGWFASLLLVGTILFVLLFLPHLLPHRAVPRPDYSPFRWFTSRPWGSNRVVIGAVVFLTILLSFFSDGSSFEADMARINYMTDAHRKDFAHLRAMLSENQHILYYVTEGATPDSALEANEQSLAALADLKKRGDISRVGGIDGLIPSRARQAERLGRWEAFWKTRRDSVLHILNEEASRLGFRADAFGAFNASVSRSWSIEGLEFFNPLRQTVGGSYVFERPEKTMIVNLLYLDADRAPAVEKALNDRNTASIAFDAESMTRRMIASLSDNFNYVLYVCGFIVFIFLLFSLGRLELSLIAFLPLALSWVWILGLMGIFDMKFNIVNIILATFIFGQGDDYTIFMTEGLIYEYTYRRRTLASYKDSIALSAAIMFVGMGAMIFARHPALRSLGEVTVVGMFSVVVMAYIFPPFLFGFLTSTRGKARRMPVTLRNLLISIYAFTYFLVLSFGLTVVGWVMFTLGKKTSRKKAAYHRMLYSVARFTMHHFPQVRTTVENTCGEDFRRPSIILCNHQSHLDLMCLLMLTPKLIILTNDWVWHSPFYGQLIRYADFYPVTEGLDRTLEHLREAKRQGYSIAIFPEGTRSPDCSLLRFRRGAFFLAEQLNMDLLPVVLHGTGHVLPKQDFMLRRGSIHVRVLPRITPADTRFGTDHIARARQLRQFYRAEYEALCRRVETPAYFADLVLHNYIYKGPSVERAVRHALRQHDNYTAEISALPDSGEVTLRNTGYGEQALLAALVKPHLRITAVEPDDDRRAIAEHCAARPANLQYVSET